MALDDIWEHFFKKQFTLQESLKGIFYFIILMKNRLKDTFMPNVKK